MPLPKHERQTIKRKVAAAKKKQAKQRALKAKRAFAHQAQKTALNEMAEQAFGEEGLTPARLEALSKVVLGPDAGMLTINNPQALHIFLKRAKRKFTSLAENYVNLHHQSVVGAYSVGEFDTAARHAEWALEALGDKEDRVIEPAPRQQQAAPQMAPIMVGVNLGGVPRDHS